MDFDKDEGEGLDHCLGQGECEGEHEGDGWDEGRAQYENEGK